MDRSLAHKSFGCMIHQLLQRVFSTSRFALAFGILAIGTTVSQGLMVLIFHSTPHYSPLDVNSSADRAPILGRFARVACPRFNIAIPLPERDVVTLHLLVLSLISERAASLPMTLMVMLFGHTRVAAIGAPTVLSITTPADFTTVILSHGLLFLLIFLSSLQLRAKAPVEVRGAVV